MIKRIRKIIAFLFSPRCFHCHALIGWGNKSGAVIASLFDSIDVCTDCIKTKYTHLI